MEHKKLHMLKFTRYLKRLASVFCTSLCLFVFFVPPANALWFLIPCIPCLVATCTDNDCLQTKNVMNEIHDEYMEKIKDLIQEEFKEYGTLNVNSISSVFLNALIGEINAEILEALQNAVGDVADAAQELATEEGPDLNLDDETDFGFEDLDLDPGQTIDGTLTDNNDNPDFPGDVVDGPSQLQPEDEESSIDILNDVLDEVGETFDALLENLEGAIEIESASGGWLLDFFREHFVRALMMMTEQLSAVGMQQVMMYGTFLDAQQQMETQRLLSQLHTEAHRDYHPSEDFCLFGTNTRSVGPSEQKGRASAEMINGRLIKRQIGAVNVSGSLNRDQDREARWSQFLANYCDPSDNNGFLYKACGGAGSRPNRDIDFTRLVDHPRTLEIDPGSGGPDMEDALALGANLYGHDTLSGLITPAMMRSGNFQHLYLALRSVAAQRGVAQNSYAALVGMKAQGTTDVGEEGEQTRNFLGAIMKELGIIDDPNLDMEEDDIYELIGQNPSYYAQLEILAKRIYQNPNFYADLYDKPANVARKSVALKAIELMVDRAIYESQLRREMMASAMLSAQLHKPFKNVHDRLSAYKGGTNR